MSVHNNNNTGRQAWWQWRTTMMTTAMSMTRTTTMTCLNLVLLSIFVLVQISFSLRWTTPITGWNLRGAPVKGPWAGETLSSDQLRPNDLWMLSFNDLHEMAGRATPQKLRDYKSALQLYKTMDQHIPTTDWINLNLNAVVTSRQTKLIINKNNQFRVFK